MEIQQPIFSGRMKTDISYAKGFLDLSKQRYFSIFLNSLKLLSMTTTLIINLVKFNPPHNVMSCLGLNLSASIMGIFYSVLAVIYIFRSTTVYLNIAEQLGHICQQEPLANYESLHDCYSSEMYVAKQNIRINDINLQTQSLYDNIAKKEIDSKIKVRYNGYRNGQNIYSLLNFASLVYSIIILASTDLNTPTKINLIIYVVVVGLSQILMVLGFVLLAISPIICVVLIFFCCFCGNKRDGEVFIEVPIKDAELKDIANAGGDCAICYQNIGVGDKIYVLTCSQKHVYHVDCLKHWTKVKNNCPICRAEIPMGAQRAGVAQQNQNNYSP